MPTTYSILMKDSDGFYQPLPVASKAALTAPLTTVTSDTPGSPAYDMTGEVTQSAPWGFRHEDNLITLIQVIANLQTRVDELETQLQTWNLLT